MSSVIVADHGAHTLRLGFSKDTAPRLHMPNQVAYIRNDGRELVGEETESETLRHHEMLEYKRAHQRGCLLDTGVAEKVWTRALSQLGGFTVSDTRSLIVTEPPILPHQSRVFSDELFFEKLRFDSVARVCSHACVAADWFLNSKLETRPLVQIVVECGYSATWIVPLIDGNACFPAACKRVDVGGKLLTNLFKEELTWRHVNLMDSTHLVEKCKREVCFVGPLPKNNGPPAAPLDYLLPDHVTDFEGRVVSNEEARALEMSGRTIIRLSAQERCNIPEVLFRPSRIKLHEAGVAEAVAQCIADLPWELREKASRNILLSGGSTRFPGFTKRLREDLDLFVPMADSKDRLCDWSEHYKESAWRGARHFANSPAFDSHAITRRQYEEEGSYYVRPGSALSGDYPLSGKKPRKTTSTKIDIDSNAGPSAGANWWQ